MTKQLLISMDLYGYTVFNKTAHSNLTKTGQHLAVKAACFSFHLTLSEYITERRFNITGSANIVEPGKGY